MKSFSNLSIGNIKDKTWLTRLLDIRVGFLKKMLLMLFQYGLEPVLIQRILISFEAILKSPLFAWIKSGKIFDNYQESVVSRQYAYYFSRQNDNYISRLFFNKPVFCVQGSGEAGLPVSGVCMCRTQTLSWANNYQVRTLVFYLLYLVAATPLTPWGSVFKAEGRQIT